MERFSHMLMAELKLVADLFVVSMRCDDPEALISVWVPLHKTNTYTLSKTPRRAIRITNCETFDPGGSQRTITFANEHIHTKYVCMSAFSCI